MQTFTLPLAPEQHWRVPAAERVSIRCERGLLWVTVRGEAQDYLLRAGEALVLERARGVLVGAIEPAQVVVDVASERPALMVVAENVARGLRRFAFWTWMRPAGLASVNELARQSSLKVRDAAGVANLRN